MKSLKLKYVALIIALIIFADQAIKIWIKTTFEVGQETQILGIPWFKLHFIENSGMAWGLKFWGETGKVILTLFRLAAVIFGVWYLKKIVREKYSRGFIIHETAHKLGLHSNATMLYGHIEKFEHRIDHMRRLRELQDKTNGFNTFIPLKFRNKDNDMSNVPESTHIEDMKMYAIARIYLDNFPHLKAYWPMIGRQNAQLSLSFGVDDIDGTIDDSTKIYSMAGSEEQSPSMTTAELVTLIRQAKREPVERDTLYNEIKNYSNIPAEVNAGLN